MGVTYLRVRNWEKLQNADIFKKSHGRPPWVKLYVHHDFELEQLPVTARLLFYEILKLTARGGVNAISSDPQWLASQVSMKTQDVLKALPLLLEGAWLSETKTPRRSRKIRESSETQSRLEEKRIETPKPPSGKRAKATCPECGLVCKTPIALSEHRERVHWVEPLQVVA